MKANTRTPAEIFGYHLRYIVPLFQRPYVWNEQDQWEPLWEDVRTLTEQLVESPPQPFGASQTAPHFLGAIVVEQQAGVVGFIAVWHVVDGQQRLTTLQLLLDAAQEVVERHGAPLDAQALRILVLNETATQHPDERFKVWPTDRDRPAFRAVMDNGVVVSPEIARTPIARAHAYFMDRITEWADVSGDPTKVQQRLNALVRALRDYLKVVVIDLEPGDNAQVIFETLNHRGTRLLAADLVKNFVFQLAQAQHQDVAELYAKHWRTLDDDHWRGLTSQGRLYRPRIDVFLNYWLTMKLLRDIPADRVFAEFRDRIASVHDDVGALIREIAHDAEVYARLEALPASSVEGLFHYRVVRALDTGAVTPVLLWLLRFPEHELPAEQRHRALRTIESWLVRRTLARLTGKNVNQVILELLQELATSGPATAGERTEAFLARQSAESRLWPDDATVRATIAEAPIYTAVARPRLRMVLEAIEDDIRRTGYGEQQPCPHLLTVEHVMPRGWRDEWPVAPGDIAAALRRDRAVHRLGNLTLVTGKHNSALSNRPWRNKAATGKYDYLLEHSQLMLNARIVASHPDEWTEDDIDARTAALTDRILALWPRVGAAPATVVSATPEEPEPVDVSFEDAALPAHSGKYRALYQWLRTQDRDEVRLSFAEVEHVLDLPLPASSRLYLQHWYSYDGSAVVRAVHDAGWRAAQVDLDGERVTFVRADV